MFNATQFWDGRANRLFNGLEGMPAVLGDPRVIQGVGVTHLRYPVRKAARV